MEALDIFQNVNEYFCGNVAEEPSLIGSHYVDHYYACNTALRNTMQHKICNK